MYHFCLNRSFKGPFVVQSVTSTSAVTRSKDIEDAEEINVSRQRLSICNDEMMHYTPWIGHGNRLHRRRQIRKRKPNVKKQVHMKNKERFHSHRLTRSGCQVNKPSRYCSVTIPESSQEKREEVVKTKEWLLFITHSRLLFYFVFCTRSISFHTIYQLQMALGV